MNENVWPLILLGGGLLAFLLLVTFLSKNYSLNNFKSKTVGDGQHGMFPRSMVRESGLERGSVYPMTRSFVSKISLPGVLPYLK